MAALLLVAAFFELLKDFIGPVDKRRGHSRHPCYMDTKAMCTSPRSQFTKEYDFIAHFFIGNMVIADAVEFVFEFIELMVMCGKKCFGHLWRLVQVFGNAPGNGYAIISRSATPDFIEQDKAS